MDDKKTITMPLVEYERLLQIKSEKKKIEEAKITPIKTNLVTLGITFEELLEWIKKNG